jgi:hypothetical protein
MVCALTIGVATLGAAFASFACAEPPRLIFYNNFNAKTPFPMGAAVDQLSGDVYVAGVIELPFPPGHVSKFDASGNLLSPSPFDEGYDSGAAVDPQTKDVYILKIKGFGTAEVETLDPNTGAQVGPSFPVEPANNFLGVLTAVQIAADSSGNVYVPVVPQNEVLEYSPSGTLLNTFNGGPGEGALSGPTGVSVDSSGNLWIADRGNNRIEELEPSGVPVLAGGKPVEIKSEGVESVALDGRGNVFAVVKNGADSCGSIASPCPHLIEYGPTGVQVADVGAGSFGVKEGNAGIPNMVAVNESSGRAYVTDARKELVWVFGPPTAPTVGRELTSEVTTSEAKLGALVNPGGAATSYRFEYDTREYREGEAPHGQSTPLPEGSVGEGVTPRAVWAAASGLAPGTTYHYRVVATNELAPGGVAGPDQTFTTETAEQAACPKNERFRGGFSAKLPDCRAYELVTPPVENSSQPTSASSVAPDGNAIQFETREPLPGAPSGGYDYVATRDQVAGRWSSEDLIPLESYSGILCSEKSDNSSVEAYSDGPIARAVVSVGAFTRASNGEPGKKGLYESCNAEGLQVVSGEPIGYKNLLAREKSTGAYQLINAPDQGATVPPADAHFKGGSADLSHVVFTEMAPLVQDAPYGVENLFEWDEGALRLLTVLPTGTPATGSLAAEGADQSVRHPISADGSHILFTSGGDLYDRIDGNSTVQIDKKQAGAAGPSGGGILQTASKDGSKVLFLDENKLTEDSTAEAGEPDLYECALTEGASECELTDLTVAKAGEHADVLSVSGLDSGVDSRVYFTAKGVLAANKREYDFTDIEGKNHRVVEEAKEGEDNLYMEREGTIVFIAEGGGVGPTSPDGMWLAFGSSKSLTGYDNIAADTKSAIPEIFVYSAVTGEVACASCNPSGDAPTGAGKIELPAVTARPLSAGGRLFFQTTEALVPSDTNGQRDVYEYENGRLSLISSGTSLNESKFVGASESGDDAFFESTQALVPQDTQEESHVIYDARVGGGFPALAPPPPCVTADACRAPVSSQPSIFGAPSSQTFSGAGNLAPPVKAKPKKAKHKKRKTKASACKRAKHRRHASCGSRTRRVARGQSHKGGK